MGIQTAAKEQLTDRTLAAAGTLQEQGISSDTVRVAVICHGRNQRHQDRLSCGHGSCALHSQDVLLQQNILRSFAGYGCWNAICQTGMNFETGRDPFSGGIEGLMGQLLRDRSIRDLPNGGSKKPSVHPSCVPGAGREWIP